MSDGAPEFSVRYSAPPPTFSVVGDIDIATSTQLAELVAKSLDGHDPGPVVFDLSGVGFIDSSGLAVLIYAVNAGHAVAVRGASAILRRVIEATGLVEVLEVEP